MGLRVEYWEERELSTINAEGGSVVYDLITGYVVVDGLGRFARLVPDYLRDMNAVLEAMARVEHLLAGASWEVLTLPGEGRQHYAVSLFRGIACSRQTLATRKGNVLPLVLARVIHQVLSIEAAQEVFV